MRGGGKKKRLRAVEGWGQDQDTIKGSNSAAQTEESRSVDIGKRTEKKKTEKSHHKKNGRVARFQKGVGRVLERDNWKGGS